MVAHAFATCGAIVLATVFFTVPLVLKFHVYKPEVKHVASGDVIQIEDRISSTWCQAVELSSNSSFQTFLYDSEPQVDGSALERTVVSQDIILPNKGQKYWGLHLLRGSKVNIMACIRLRGGDLTVVKGYRALRRCLQEYRFVMEVGDDVSLEDSQSQSESDDETSSISSSQGAPSNETDRAYRCRDALYHVQLPSAYDCRAMSGKANVRPEALQQLVEHTDHYYYIFSSDTYLNIIPNEFSVEFVLDRTHYDYSVSSSNCTSSVYCQMNVTLSSEEKIVVQMDGVNGSFKAESLRVACRPREWIFCIFYAGFLIVIFLCAFQ